MGSNRNSGARAIFLRDWGFATFVAATIAASLMPHASMAAREPAPAAVDPNLVEAFTTRPTARVIVRLRPARQTLATAPRRPIDRIADRQTRLLGHLAHHQLRRVKRFKHISALAFELPRDGLQELMSRPEVEAVGLDLPIRTALDSAVTVTNVDVAQNEFGLSGEGVTIAVLDTGIDTDHPNLAGALVAEQCFCSISGGCCPGGGVSESGPGAAEDEERHGTHVAGIIASAGIVAAPGVAPGASIVAIRVLDGDGDGVASDLVAALEWLRTDRPDVSIVNMSIGTNEAFTGECDNDADVSASSLAEAVANLAATGAVVVAATGNTRKSNAVIAPACSANALAVGAVNDRDQVPGFSNSAATLDLLAPGVSITSSRKGGGTLGLSGTSQAAPHVAGTLALLQQARPDQSTASLVATLTSTGVSITDSRNGLVRPRIDARASFDAICDQGPDLDSDQLSDCLERHVYRTSPSASDSDQDGLPDGIELGVASVDADPSRTTDPLNPDTDGDGRADGHTSGPCEDCNNNGRVDPGESDPSSEERFLTVDSQFGLFAYPGQASARPLDCVALANALTVAGTPPSIARLSPETKEFETCTPPSAAFEIRPGVGYVLSAGVSGEIAIPFAPGCSDIELTPGPNLIGHPSPANGLSCFAFLDRLTPEIARSMQRFDSTRGAFSSCMFAGSIKVWDDFPIELGAGYFVHAQAGARVLLPGCPHQGADDQSEETTQGSPIAGRLSSAAFDLPAVTCDVVQLPASGNVTVERDCSFEYAPSTAFTGSDTFTYRSCLTDTPGECDTARVTVAVSAP